MVGQDLSSNIARHACLTILLPMVYRHVVVRIRRALLLLAVTAAIPTAHAAEAKISSPSVVPAANARAVSPEQPAVPLAFASAPVRMVTLGAALPLSGDLAPYGHEALDGIRLAISDLNARHVVIDGEAVQWNIDVRDDEGRAAKAAEVAHQLVEDHVAGVVGDLDGSSTEASAPIYFAAGIQQITPASGDPATAHHGWTTFHRIVANDYAVGASLAFYAGRKLKAKTAMVVDDGSSEGEALTAAFERAADAGGLQLLPEPVHARDGDVAALAAKVKEASPDVVFYRGAESFGAELLKRLRALGVKARVLGGKVLCSARFAGLAGDAANAGVVCAQASRPLARMPQAQKWMQRFKERFGADPTRLTGPHAYDAAMTLAQAMIKAGSTDPHVYGDALRDPGYDGVTRNDIRFNADGELVSPSITISTFSRGAKVDLAR